MREIEKWMEKFKAAIATSYDQLDDLLARMKETQGKNRKERNT